MRSEAIYIMESMDEPPVWYVVWGMLGYDDYHDEVEPWCEANLQHPFAFAPSSCVRCCTEEDAMMLFLRYK